MKKRINATDAPQPRGAYSQGVVWNNILFTAGIGPVDPVTNAIVGTTIIEQTHQVMKNLGAILQANNMNYDHVLKATVHLARLQDDFAAFNDVYKSYFSDATLPVRTTVGSVLNGILVEIDFVAAGQP